MWLLHYQVFNRILTMKYIFFIFFIVFITKANAQRLTEKDWNILIEYLDSEDWENSSKISGIYLGMMQDDTAFVNEAAILRYMFITSLAGLMNNKKLTKDEAIKKVNDMEGYPIFSPVRPVKKKAGFNSFYLGEGSDSTIHCTNSNKKNTAIFSFDVVYLSKKITGTELDKHEGQPARVGGYIEKISIEGISLPRFRLIIKEGFIEFE